MPESATVTRDVGTCAHCGGKVLLRVARSGLRVERSASCPCGATTIPVSFFRAITKAIRG